MAVQTPSAYRPHPRSCLPAPFLEESLVTDAIQQTFGIDPGALTANEASYLSGFRTADELRNRAAKAAEEIDLRLRAKGFQLEARPAPLNQEGEG